MASWAEFAQQAPELEIFGRSRYGQGVAYLGTLKPDGGPRVHPVTPIVGERLFLFMEPASPKGKDLQRDGRFTLHCAVENMNGGGGEFYVTGRASLCEDHLLREQAVRAAPYSPDPAYILFVLDLESAFMNQYIEGKATVRRWKQSVPQK